MFLSYFSHYHVKRFSWTHSTESRRYKTGKYTVCRRVPASFSPQILQAGAVKGLIIIIIMATTAVTINVFFTISVVSHLPVALMAATTKLATTREKRTFMMEHFWLL